MNRDWNKFLADQGVITKDDRVVSMGHAELTSCDLESTCLCDLSALGVIRASGEDAQSFLHGQFTNDLSLVSPSISQLSSYCNPKGRMLSIFRIFMRGDNYHMLLHRDVLEATLKKLVMFKLMAKVDLEDISNDLVVIGIAGPSADSLLADTQISVPTELNHCIQAEATTIIRIPSKSSRILFITNVDQAISIWNQLSSKCPIANNKLWDLHDIESGIPQITTNTIETFIPQMTNLELIDGVSFNKGCYPGQEIVARTHYLGKPNRRMFRINVSDENAPEPGVNIYSPKNETQPVGKIVTAQKLSEGMSSALVVMRTENAHDNDLHVASTTGPSISIQSLPYSLDTKSN